MVITHTHMLLWFSAKQTVWGSLQHATDAARGSGCQRGQGKTRPGVRNHHNLRSERYQELALGTDLQRSLAGGSRSSSLSLSDSEGDSVIRVLRTTAAAHATSEQQHHSLHGGFHERMLVWSQADVLLMALGRKTSTVARIHERLWAAVAVM